MCGQPLGKFTDWCTFFVDKCHFARGQPEKMLSLPYRKDLETMQYRYAKAEEAFFHLLRLSLEPHEDVVTKLDDEEWQEVYAIACKQAMAGVVLDGAECLRHKPPVRVLLPWIGTVEQVEQRNRLMNRMVVKIDVKFRQEGMDHVLLKGQGIAALYRKPLHRMSGDVDLWMAASRKEVVEYVRRRCPEVEVVYHHVDFPVMKEVEMELHFTPSWMNDWFVNRRLQRLFREWMPDQIRHTVMLPEGAGEVAVPTSAMNRVYVLVHIYRHLFDEGIGLRQLMDYYYVLKQPCSPSERAATVRVLSQLRMKRFASAVMYVLQRVFAMPDEWLLVPPSSKYGKRLLDEIMMAGNFGQYDPRIVRDSHETSWGKFVRKVTRNMHFLTDYPGEVLWSPLFKIWHYTWRLLHGYLP